MAEGSEPSQGGFYGPRGCRWPMWPDDQARPSHRYCCQPISSDKRPYCQVHQVMALAAEQPRQPATRPTDNGNRRGNVAAVSWEQIEAHIVEHGQASQQAVAKAMGIGVSTLRRAKGRALHGAARW